MEQFKKVLKQTIVRSSDPQLFGATFIVGMWDKTLTEVYGTKSKDKTRALSFRGGVLKVGVYSRAWMLELKLKEEGLVSQLNYKLSSNIVKSLKTELTRKEM